VRADGKESLLRDRTVEKARIGARRCNGVDTLHALRFVLAALLTPAPAVVAIAQRDDRMRPATP